MKKGFTVIELIVSFSLVLVIVMFLFQIVIHLKNLYTISNLKTELLNKQSIISNQINKKFSNKTIVSLSKCGSYCVDFLYEDGSNSTLTIDYDNNTIEFENYKTNLPDGSYIKNAKVSIVKAAIFKDNNNNSLLIIEIPIYNDKIKNQDYIIKTIYQFNDKIYNLSAVSFTA